MAALFQVVDALAGHGAGPVARGAGHRRADGYGDDQLLGDRYAGQLTCWPSRSAWVRRRPLAGAGGGA